jgi:hypothetical protein
MEQHAMALIDQYRAEIASVLLPLVGSYIRYVLTPVAKIVHSKSHSFCYTIRGGENGNVLAFTETYFFQNKGRRSAEEVEIIFGRRPQNFSIWPQRDYSCIQSEEGFFVIKATKFGKNESFTINMLEVGITPPMLTNVRVSDGTSKAIQMAAFQIFPNWMNAFALFLLFMGMCVTMYIAIKLLEFIIS